MHGATCSPPASPARRCSPTAAAPCRRSACRPRCTCNRSAALAARSSPAPAISRPASICTNAGGPYQVLNVHNLTTNIAPASGVDGVLFTSNGAVELNVDTGPFAILATDANGIFAASNGGPVTINSTADIVTTGGSAVGIQGSAQNALLTITSSGNIATSGNNAFGIAAGTIQGDIIVNFDRRHRDVRHVLRRHQRRDASALPAPRKAPSRSTRPATSRPTGDNAIGINASAVYGAHRHHVVRQHRRVRRRCDRHQRADRRATLPSPRSATLPRSATSISRAPILGAINGSQYGAVEITSFGKVATAESMPSASMPSPVHGDGVVIGSIVTLATSRGIAARAMRARPSFRRATSALTARGAGITASDGDVAVVSTGDITTTGDTSDGINVVSTSGMAAVVNSGNISATGFGSAGIYAAGDTGHHGHQLRHRDRRPLLRRRHA